jgi:hypothetical protein
MNACYVLIVLLACCASTAPHEDVSLHCIVVDGVSAAARSASITFITLRSLWCFRHASLPVLKLYSGLHTGAVTNSSCATWTGSLAKMSALKVKLHHIAATVLRPLKNDPVGQQQREFNHIMLRS